jgi:signal transduction histidine kinase
MELTRESQRPTRRYSCTSPLEDATSSADQPRELFAAYVAHELRTPLASQRALLELTLADPNADVTAWREIGADLLSACRQQERVIEACLTLARSRHVPQRSEPLDLATVASGVLRAHDLSRLAAVVTLEPAWTTGDPGLVERLVANLVSNATRHNIVGGRIDVGTSIRSGRAVLSVANTGRLVPTADLERLSRPFQRLDSSPGDRAGLGLAIVEAIARAHDATVAVEARSDGGLAIDVAFTALV